MQLKLIPGELVEKAKAGDEAAETELAQAYHDCEFVISINSADETVDIVKSPPNLEGILEHQKDFHNLGIVCHGIEMPPLEDEPEPKMPEDKKERIKKIVYEAVEAIATRTYEGDDGKDLQVDSVDFDEYGTLVAKIYGGFNGSIAMHSAYYCTQWAHLIELLGFWGVEAWLVETWIDCLDDVWTLKLGLDTKEN